jgi:hypothetical protein
MSTHGIFIDQGNENKIIAKKRSSDIQHSSKITIYHKPRALCSQPYLSNSSTSDDPGKYDTYPAHNNDFHMLGNYCSCRAVVDSILAG